MTIYYTQSEVLVLMRQRAADIVEAIDQSEPISRIINLIDGLGIIANDFPRHEAGSKALALRCDMPVDKEKPPEDIGRAFAE